MQNELKEFSEQMNLIKKSNINLIKQFIEIESKITDPKLNSINNIFPGWRYDLNLTQFKIVQRILHRQCYPSKSNKLIFDIESNKYGEKKIVQIAYYVIDELDNVIDCDMYYVFNEGVYSDYYKKIKYPTLKEFGVAPHYLFHKLQHVISQCDVLVGHNITTFDCKLLKKYFAKLNLNIDLDEKICYDTMKKSRYITNLKNKKGGSKCATLAELSQFFELENNSDENYHDALYDVHITYLCYVNLAKLV